MGSPTQLEVYGVDSFTQLPLKSDAAVVHGHRSEIGYTGPSIGIWPIRFINQPLVVRGLRATETQATHALRRPCRCQ
jgi:hypothetical protein